jgi:deazaflavin-dependent oxidoreductase (nitroreductase family)
MDQDVARALAQDLTIDITTTGRKSGLPRRIETWFHRVDGRYYLSGSPGRRDWYANLVANPEFTFHLKQTVTADLPARARPITDREERTVILREVTARVGQANRLPEWVASSPLVEVTFEPPAS